METNWIEKEKYNNILKMIGITTVLSVVFTAIVGLTIISVIESTCICGG